MYIAGESLSNISPQLEKPLQTDTRSPPLSALRVTLDEGDT